MPIFPGFASLLFTNGLSFGTAITFITVYINTQYFTKPGISFFVHCQCCRACRQRHRRIAQRLSINIHQAQIVVIRHCD